jgi:transcriptional regulator with XRE-family HTH domain
MTLRDARLRRKLTQDQLAEQSGIAQSIISRLETGELQSPSWETVALLCRVLKYKPEDIFPIPDSRQAVAS